MYRNLCFFFAVALAACSQPAAPTPDVVPEPEASAVRVCVMQDKSGSARKQRTPQITLEHLVPVTHLLRERGGELALGLIDDDSNQGLIRLHVPLPEPVPVAPEREGNRFKYQEALRAYETVRAEFERTEGRRHKTVDQNLEHFRQDTGALLSTPARSRRTDVFGAVTRCEKFLNEPAHGPLERYLVLITDAEDTASGTFVPEPLQSEAHLLLVNGMPGLGDLAALGPIRFESITSAIRYIVTPSTPNENQP